MLESLGAHLNQLLSCGDTMGDYGPTKWLAPSFLLIHLLHEIHWVQMIDQASPCQQSYGFTSPLSLTSLNVPVDDSNALLPSLKPGEHCGKKTRMEGWGQRMGWSAVEWCRPDECGSGSLKLRVAILDL